MTQTISLTTFEEYADKEWRLDEFFGLINEAACSIPSEHRGTARVMFDAYEGYATLKMIYERPETPEEEGARERLSARFRAEEEARLRSEYQRLKAKFEGGES